MAIPIKAVLSVSTTGFKTAMGGATKLLGGFVALTKAATIALVGLTAAFSALVLRQTAIIDRLGKVSKVTGVATDTLQKFGFAAELAGVSTDQAQVALRRFSRRLGEAQKGTGELLPALRRLGIETRNADGTFKDAEEVLFELADGIAETEGQSAKLAIAFKAFDSEGAELVNTLNEGGDALRRVFDEAEALGFILSQEAIQGVEDFNDEFNKLQAVIGGLANTFVAELAPALRQVITDFLAFLKQASVEKGGFEELGSYLKNEFFNILILITKAFAGLYNIFVRIGNVLIETGRKFGIIEDEVGNVQKAIEVLEDLDVGPTFNFGNILGDLLEFKTISNDVKEILEEALGPAGVIVSDEERLAAIERLKEKLLELGETEGFTIGEIDVENLVAYLNKLRDAEPLVITITKGVEDQRTQWERIKDAIQAGIDRMVAFQQASIDFTTLMENVATRLGTPLERLTKTLEDGLVKGVEMFEDSLTDAIMTGKADFSALGDHIKQVIAKALVQKFISGPILALFGLGGLAKGGTANAGTPYIVGEEGPELFVPGQTGTVVPNDQLAGSVGMGAATAVTYNINAVDARSFKQLVAQDPEFLFNVTQAGARRVPG